MGRHPATLQQSPRIVQKRPLPCRSCASRVNRVLLAVMNLPDSTLGNFRGPLADAMRELVENWQLRDETATPGESSPPLLEEAFSQLLEAMQRSEASLGGERPLVQTDSQASNDDISELGAYALELFDQTLDWAKQLNLPEVYQTLQAFTVAMARWIARHGGHIYILEPVVDALAQLANQTNDSAELVELYRAMGDIMNATVPAIRQDLEKNNPGRPWRLLHLNRAIVATRSHRPDVMEQAFAVLTEHLPEDAPRFFSEGMEQMDLLNYPPQVREVMDRYYRKWSVNRSLH